MNLMNMMLNKGNTPSNSLTVGGLLGLWNAINDKIVILPVYIIYSKQAKDRDLQKHVNDRISIMRKQIGEIQKLFKNYNFEAPTEPNWDRKLNNEAFVLSRAILDDVEIALGLKEHIKAVLSLETEALRDATTSDVRDLVLKLVTDEQKYYEALTIFIRKKNWSSEPPMLIQQ